MYYADNSELCDRFREKLMDSTDDAVPMEVFNEEVRVQMQFRITCAVYVDFVNI